MSTTKHISETMKEQGEKILEIHRKGVKEAEKSVSRVETAIEVLRRIREESNKQKGEIIGYKMNQLALLEKDLSGLQKGVYMVVGKASAGKSLFIINMCFDVLKSNDDVTCVYYTLDDDTDEIIRRFVALQSAYSGFYNSQDKENLQNAISINEAQFKLSSDREKHKQEAYKEIEELIESERLLIKNNEEIKNIVSLDKDIEKVKAKNNKLVVFIDALYNLETEKGRSDIRGDNIDRANKIKEMYNKYKVPFILTGEVQKNVSGRLTRNNIMESGKYVYNAHTIITIYPNEDESKGEEAEEKFKRMTNLAKATINIDKNKITGITGTREVEVFKQNCFVLFTKDLNSKQGDADSLFGDWFFSKSNREYKNG